MTNMPASQKKLSATRTPRSIPLAEAKAKFSSLVSNVEQKHLPVTILRRGVPVAQLVPFPDAPVRELRGSMAGKGQELGDIVSPYLDEWTVSPWPEPNPDAGDE